MEIRNPAVVSERSDDEQSLTSKTKTVGTAAPFNFHSAPSCRRMEVWKTVYFNKPLCFPSRLQRGHDQRLLPTYYGTLYS